MTALLEVDRLSVSYGGVHALADVDLEVAAGELVGLIGPNGAGKTTLIDAVTGFTAATGRVVLDGEDVSSLAPHQRSRKGLTRTWQTADLFEDLSVRENLRVAMGSSSTWADLRELVVGRVRSADTEGALERLGLTDVADSATDVLPEGTRKLVGVARALATNPRLVCLDEPAAGLDVAGSAALGRHLRNIVESGTAALLVDHDMGLVLSICDRIVVLEFGAVIAAGTPEHIRSDPAVIRAYLGDTGIVEDWR